MRRLFILAGLAALILAGAPSTALASERSVTPSAPVAVPALEVQIWPNGEPGSTVLIVSATLPPSAQLPATVRVPIPESMELVWAGEILGGDPADDLARPTQSVEANGGRYLQFELSQSRQAQVEVKGLPPTVKGDRVNTRIAWLQSAEASQTGFSVRIPSGASKAKIDPAPSGAPQRNELGDSLYGLPTRVLKVGGGQVIEVEYWIATANPGAPSNGVSTTLIVLGVLLAVAIAVLAWIVSRQRRSPAAPTEDGPDTDY